MAFPSEREKKTQQHLSPKTRSINQLSQIAPLLPAANKKQQIVFSIPISRTDLHFVDDVVSSQNIVLLVEVTNGVFLCPDSLARTREANHHYDLHTKTSVNSAKLATEL